MLKFLPFIALSAGTLCFVNNCERCSSSSPYICLGCETSFNLTSSGCHYIEAYKNEIPPNCRVSKENKSCLECEKDYHEVNGFAKLIAMMIAFALNHMIVFQKIWKMIKKQMRRNASKAAHSAIIQWLAQHARRGTIKIMKIIVLNVLRNARLAHHQTCVILAKKKSFLR